MNSLGGILESAPDDCVKILASDGSSFIEAMENVKKLEEVTKDSALETLKAARTAFKQKYPVLIERGLGDEEFEESGKNLEDFLNAETFYDRMADISRIEKEISKLYEEKYLADHKQRSEVYQQIIDEIKGHIDWININENQQKMIISPLVSHVCTNVEEDTEYDIHFDSAGVLCSKCHASIGQIDSEITAASTLKNKALEKILEVTLPPEEKYERVKITSFLGNSINDLDELEEGIERLKYHLQKLLAEGKKVILE